MRAMLTRRQEFFATLCWAPQEEGDDVDRSKNFPQYETKVIEPTGDKMAPRLKLRPAQHNQITLPQLDSEVVNLTGLAENKALIVSNGKRIVCSKKTGKQEVDCIARLKRRTGVHSLLAVSLHKTI